MNEWEGFSRSSWSIVWQVALGLPSLVNVIFASVQYVRFVRAHDFERNLAQIILILEVIENLSTNRYIGVFASPHVHLVRVGFAVVDPQGFRGFYPQFPAAFFTTTSLPISVATSLLVPLFAIYHW